MTIIKFAFLISTQWLVIAPRPNVGARLATVGPCQTRTVVYGKHAESATKFCDRKPVSLLAAEAHSMPVVSQRLTVTPRSLVLMKLASRSSFTSLAMRVKASSQLIRCHLSDPGARYSGYLRRLSLWMKSTGPAPFGQAHRGLPGDPDPLRYGKCFLWRFWRHHQGCTSTAHSRRNNTYRYYGSRGRAAVCTAGFPPTPLRGKAQRGHRRSCHTASADLKNCLLLTCMGSPLLSIVTLFKCACPASAANANVTVVMLATNAGHITTACLWLLHTRAHSVNALAHFDTFRRWCSLQYRE